MYRKLVICGMSFLALMTLVVSAQEPLKAGRQPSNSLAPQPLYAPGAEAVPMWDGSGHYGVRGLRREEVELSQRSQELVKQLAKAEGEKRERIKDQLTDTLGKQFDARQKRHQDEIAALEKQLKQLKEFVDKRKENRREIISKRMDQLVREADGLGW
jgi:hypothetical protein